MKNSQFVPCVNTQWCLSKAGEPSVCSCKSRQKFGALTQKPSEWICLRCLQTEQLYMAGSPFRSIQLPRGELWWISGFSKTGCIGLSEMGGISAHCRALLILEPSVFKSHVSDCYITTRLEEALLCVRHCCVHPVSTFQVGQWLHQGYG